MAKWILTIVCLACLGVFLYLGQGNYFQQTSATITSLTELDDHPDATDLFAIVDGGTTKKIEHHNMLKYDVLIKPTSYTVTKDDGGKIITNTGATVDVTYLLPECESVAGAGVNDVTEGWWIAFLITDTSHAFVVDPDAQDTIRDFASGATEAGESISGDQVMGSAIKLMCVQCDDIGNEEDDYNMMSMGYVGVWTAFD